MTPQQKDILTTKLFDSPESLSQEEIELVMSDQELLELYHTAVLFKDSKPSDITFDMDKEWDSMSQRLGLSSDYQPQQNEMAQDETVASASTTVTVSHSIFSSAFWTNRQWRKYAAVTAVFISITAIAAITTHYVVNQNREFAQNESKEPLTPASTQEIVIAEEPSEDPAPVVLQEEKIFEATTLEEIAQELSEAFGTSIEVENNVKGVRLYLRLPQGSSVDDLLTVLGQYESLSVQRDSNGKIFIGHGE